MMTNLEQLAQMGAQIVIPAATLRELIAEDRQATWMDGVEVGMRMRAVRELTDLQKPLDLKQACEALGLSDSSVRTLIDNGTLRTMQYKGINKIFIAQEEVRRFKEKSVKLIK